MIAEAETHEVDGTEVSRGDITCSRWKRAARPRMGKGYASCDQSGQPMSIALKDDNVEVRLSEVGEMTVGYFRFAKGTDLGPALVGLPGDMCQCPHWATCSRARC
jgi:hypothetical protein